VKQYLLDTSICVFFFRGKHDIDRILQEKGYKNCYVSEITVAELRFGAENSDDQERHHQLLDNFLKKIDIMPIFSSIYLFAKEKVRLRKSGNSINDDFDLLIGATAITNGLILVTDNVKHFERLEGIEIENWVIR
jgi:tRNA(fMet)-specific endonuclease VapC